MKIRDECGFTLVELLVAILIFSATAVALAMSFSTGLMAIRAAREASTALQVAKQEIEVMRDTPFNGIQPHSFPVSSLNTDGTVVIETMGTNMKKASVNVSWTSGSVRDMSVSLLTIITKDGINRE